VFNGVDIYQEGIAVLIGYFFSDWAIMGRYMGKITADILGKNALRSESWSYKNSESIKFRLTSQFDITEYVRLSQGRQVPTETQLKQEELMKSIAHCLKD